MRNGKVLSLILMIGLLFTLFTACSNQPGTSNQTTVSSGQTTKETVSPVKVDLTFSWWGGDARHNGTLAAIKLWNDSNPNIQVEGIYSGYTGYMDKLGTQFASKTAPDLFQLEDFSVQEYIDNGVLADLTSYLSTEFSGIDEFLFDYFKKDDKNYAISSGINGPVLAYNKTKLEEWGMPLPTNNETWDSLLEKCKLCTKDTDNDGVTNIWGIRDPVVLNYDYAKVMLNQFGVAFYTEDLKSTNFSDPKVIDGYKKLYEFKKAGVVLDPNIVTMDQEPILAGYVIFSPFVFSSYIGELGESEYEINCVAFPALTGGVEARQMVNGMPFAISNETEYKDEAASFIGWLLTSEEAAKTMGGMLRGVFPSEVQRKIIAAEYPNDRLANQIFGVVDYYKSLTIAPGFGVTREPENAAEFKKVWDLVREQYEYGKLSIDEMLEQIHERADPILAE